MLLFVFRVITFRQKSKETSSPISLVSTQATRSKTSDKIILKNRSGRIQNIDILLLLQRRPILFVHSSPPSVSAFGSFWVGEHPSDQQSLYIWAHNCSQTSRTFTGVLFSLNWAFMKSIWLFFGLVGSMAIKYLLRLNWEGFEWISLATLLIIRDRN